MAVKIECEQAKHGNDKNHDDGDDETLEKLHPALRSRPPASRLNVETALLNIRK
jgi:hypothetical protein